MAGGPTLYTSDSSGGGGFSITHVSSATLADNSGPTTLASVATATASGFRMVYVIKRGTNVRIGRVTVVSDGSTSNDPQDDIESEMGDCGVTWTSTVAGGNINIKWTTSNTGTAAKIGYDLYTMTTPT